jgi:Holliday junction resolvasome RuvABC DNA-binding subunit|tara:strand:- start:2007 stop:2204 length:198 start_codon:yes stop_codon:yes gene_type:complete
MASKIKSSVNLFGRSFFNAMIEFFEAIGKARAVSVLNRMGHHELAKKVMLSDATTFSDHSFEVHP